MRDKTLKARPQEMSGVEVRREPAPTELQAWIAEAAYFRAERRGFAPGHETDDWLAAEAEVAERLRTARNVI
jgi:DUF2934 family protein